MVSKREIGVLNSYRHLSNIRRLSGKGNVEGLVIFYRKNLGLDIAVEDFNQYRSLYNMRGSCGHYIPLSH